MANGAPDPSGSGPAASPLRPRRRAGSDSVLVVCRCFGVVTAAAVAADIMGGVFRCYAQRCGVLRQSSSPCLRPSGHPSSSSGSVAYPNVERNQLILLQEIATYMLLACGAVYVIAGILCLGVLKRSRQHKATSQEQAVKDLEELEKRREELVSLLIAQRPEMT